MSAPQFDFLVIGAGIAGASVGHWLAPHARIAVLEREDQPGYHATGRSAALFSEGYGTRQVRALTCASRAFLAAPPPGFAGHPILSPRGVLTIASAGQLDALHAHLEEILPHAPAAHVIDGDRACALVPVLRPQAAQAAILEPDAFDIDVHALHQGYLRGVRRHGGEVHTNAGVEHIEREADGWRVHTRTREFRAAALVNAAGAWCDEVARLAGAAPIGLQPRRRSAFTFAAPPGLRCADWPLLIDVDETFYVKPDAGMLLGSPANADPMPPQDVQPEALDIALAVERIQAATTLAIRRPARTWAGLRSFVADGDLVGGYDLQVPGFFWVAAQGGYGIQTSAAMGEACAALALGRALPPALARFGLDAAMLSPARRAARGA